jgi:dipeptidyl-peptidase-4
MLKDNNRFIWTSDRNGFKNYYLYDLSGKLHATLTNHPFEVVSIYRVDEEKNLLYYFARDGENPYKEQLHRVGLDGKGDVRLTDPKFYHRVDLAPDGKHFIDTYQAHNQPESTRLVSDEGKVLAELNKYDLSEFEKKGFKKVELFTYKAADGVTDLYGMLHFPANFDPNKKYPLLVSVYAGPETNGARETFTQPDRLTE